MSVSWGSQSVLLQQHATFSQLNILKNFLLLIQQPSSILATTHIVRLHHTVVGKPAHFMCLLGLHPQTGDAAQCPPITGSYRASYASPYCLSASSLAHEARNSPQPCCQAHRNQQETTNKTQQSATFLHFTDDEMEQIYVCQGILNFVTYPPSLQLIPIQKGYFHKFK